MKTPSQLPQTAHASDIDLSSDLPALRSGGLSVPVHLQRRALLRGGLGVTLTGVFGGGLLTACGGGDAPADTPTDTASASNGLTAKALDESVPVPRIPSAVYFSGKNSEWTTVDTERYSSATGNTTWNGIAQLSGYTPVGEDGWVELQYPSSADAGGMIVLDTASGILPWTTHRYILQLRPTGVLRYGVNNASTLSDVGYTFPSASVNHRVRLHMSAAGVVSVETTLNNGADWTVRLVMPANAGSFGASRLYWRLCSIQAWDLYEPRQAGVDQVQGTFDALYAPGFMLRSDTTYTPPASPQVLPTAKSPNLATPAYTDQEHGTKVFQVTQLSDEPDPAATELAIDYPKRQAYNRTGTRRLAVSSRGNWLCYDVAANAVIQIVDENNQLSPYVPFLGGYDCDPVWSPDDDNEIWATGDFGVGGVWKKINILTGNVSDLFPTLVGRVPDMPTAQRFQFREEGQPSLDGRYWAFWVSDAADNFLGIVTYDRLNNVVLSARTTDNVPNWVGVSCSGAYAVIGWSNSGEGLTTASAHELSFHEANGTRAYPIDDLHSNTWTELSVKNEHGDCAIAADGRDVWVSISLTPGENVAPPGYTDGDGWVYYRYMDTGVSYTYPTLSIYASKGGGGSSALHFSGRADLRPGWAVATYYGGSPVTDWNDSAVLLLELGGRNQVLRVARHHVVHETASARATPNRDLTQILFRTNRRGTGVWEQFMVGLPSWAVPQAGLLPPAAATSPVVSGSYTQGGTLQRALGTYTGIPRPTVSGNWQRSTDAGVTWADLSGSTGATYLVPTGTANGTRYRWRETGVNGLGSVAATSNAVAVAALAAPTFTQAPTAPASAYTNQQITATEGVWVGNPAPTLTRVWQRLVSGTWTDSTITTLTTALSVDGSWRLKVSATNSQGGPVVAYSNTVAVALPPAEPVPATTITFNQANGTTLEAISSAWEGISTNYVVVNGALRNGASEGWNPGMTWLTTAGGNNQSVQVTLKAAPNLTSDYYLNVHIHTNGVQLGYEVKVIGGQLILYRNDEGTLRGGPVSHGLNLATTDLTLKITNLLGRVRVYVNGATTPLIDYTDPAPLSGGYSGLSSFPGGDSSRLTISEFRYGST